MLALWLGIMKIGEQSGMIGALSRRLSPLFCRLFPDIPAGHPAFGSIFMNMAANMLGLDNAATPMGLREFGIKKVEKKLVISPVFCIFIADKQNTTKRTSDDYQGQSYRDFLYY